MAWNLLTYIQSPNGGEAEFHVYDQNRFKVSALVVRGAKAAGSVAQLAASCRIVFSCSENDDALRDVFRALLAAPALPRGLVFVDSSTVKPYLQELGQFVVDVGDEPHLANVTKDSLEAGGLRCDGEEEEKVTYARRTTR